MLRHEVRHPHRRSLVRDTERIAEVLDGQIAFLLRLLQERDAVGLGDEATGGEVVDLEALLQEVGVRRGSLVSEQPVGHRLQCHRAQPVAARDRCGRQVNAAVLEIGDRSRRARKVVDVEQLEPEALGHDAHGAVGERARDVTGRRKLLLGELFDIGQVVVTLAHPQAQLRIGAPRLLGRCDRFSLAAIELPVQAEYRLDRLIGCPFGDLHRRDAEPAKHGACLRAFQLDFERSPTIRGFSGEEVGDLQSRGVGDRLQQREFRLALAVFDEAQLASRDPDLCTQLVQRPAPRHAFVTDAVPERHQFEVRGCHSLMLAKEFRFLRG